MKNNVFMISYYDFPCGDAGATRHETLAKLFKELDYEPLVIGMGKKNIEPFEIKEYKKIKYTTLRHISNGKIAKLRNYFGLKTRLKKFLKKQNIRPDVFLLSDLPLNAYRYIKKYAKKNKIQIVHDCVEWYSKEQFKYGKYDINYIKKDYINKILIDKNMKVISITTYLDKYFKSKEIKSIVIPAILDIKENFVEKNIKESSKKTYMYAGSPGKKDNLDIILKGFSLLDKSELEKIEIQLYGVEQSDVERLIKEEEYEKIFNVLKCYGRVERKAVLDAYKKTSFSILMRNPNLRYAKAGFPTKVVESMMNSTPVITNISSDLQLYLKNEENSIIVDGYSVESFRKAIIKTISMNNEQIAKMQRKARNTAEKQYHYLEYKDKLKEFLKEK